MKIRALLVLLSFITISIIGFSSLAHESHAMHHSCLFSSSNNCAALVDPVRSSLEHLSSLQNSLQANLVQTNALTLIVVALSLIISVLALAKLKPKTPGYLQKSPALFSKNIFEVKAKFLDWLSALNKKDPLVFVVVR